MLEVTMFDFRIIDIGNDSQIIDRTLKTPVNALTLDQIMEYMEVDSQLAVADRMKRKARREAETKQRLARNPLWKIACFCGIV